MQQPPDAPITQRLRTVRRRITAAVLATFVAAWLAVAALGKGGDSSTTAATPSSSSTGTSSQGDDSSNFGSTQGGDDSGASQGAQAGPVTSSQS
jgi:hypothetical protein